jgi:hypothetical protein
MPDFIEQFFYDEKGNEINIKGKDIFLPPASLNVGDTIKYEGTCYRILKRDFIKNEKGKDISVKIFVKEL